MEEMYFFNWTFFVEGFLWLFHLHATTFEHRSKIMKYKRVNGGNILKNVHEGDKKCIKSKMSIKKHLVRCCFTSLFIKSICLQKDSYGHFFKIDCLATTCCTSVWIRLKSLDACGKKWEKRSPYETYIYVWSAQMGGVTMICRDGRRPIWFFPFFLIKLWATEMRSESLDVFRSSTKSTLTNMSYLFFTNLEVFVKSCKPFDMHSWTFVGPKI